MKKALDGGLLHAMRAFLTVVNTGSFTAAGQNMDLTTAQISRLVRELENRLGTRLLQRSTRHRFLTDAGTTYVERCRQVLTLVEVAEAEASGNAATPHGHLRLQCMGNFGQHYIAPVMAEFCAHYPQVTVEYVTSQYAPDLLARGIDVGLYLAESLVDSQIVAKRLGRTFAVMVAAPAYLERYGTPNIPADLAGHTCLRLANPSVGPEWNLVSAHGTTHSLTMGGKLVADTPDMILSASVDAIGIALLPLFSVIHAIDHGQLKRVLPDWRSADIGVYAMLPSRHFIDAKTRAWLEWMRERVTPKLDADWERFLGAGFTDAPT